MDVEIWGTVALSRDGPDGNGEDGCARTADSHFQRFGFERDGTQFFQKSHTFENLHAIGADLDAGADFRECWTFLVDFDFEARVVEAQCGGKAANAATNNNRLHSAATRTGGSGTEKCFVTSSSDMDSIMR